MDQFLYFLLNSSEAQTFIIFFIFLLLILIIDKRPVAPFTPWQNISKGDKDHETYGEKLKRLTGNLNKTTKEVDTILAEIGGAPCE